MGAFPPQHAALASLQTLVLDENQLTGTLPQQWSALRTLSRLSLSNNRFQGTLPAEWAILMQLEELNLRQNQFQGHLPPTWSALQQLYHLDLSNNELSGTLPQEWAAWRQLRRLYLWSNMLEGTLPPARATMVSLQKLDLSANRLRGQLPVQWAALRDMRELYLEHNQLTGPLPAAWQTMVNITMMELAHNQFTGGLPGEWVAMVRLFWLSLRRNALSGPLPPDWAALASLQLLDLESNLLSGPGVPAEWTGMSRLTSLDISGNRLQGPVTFCTKEWARLMYVNASHNRFEGGLHHCEWGPFLHHIDVSYNNLNGTLQWIQHLPSSVVLVNASGNTFDSPTTESLQLPGRGLFLLVVLQAITFQCPLPNRQTLNPNLVLQMEMCVPSTVGLVLVGVLILMLLVSIIIYRSCFLRRMGYLIGDRKQFRYHPQYLLLIAVSTFDLFVDPITYWHMLVRRPSSDLCSAINVHTVRPSQRLAYDQPLVEGALYKPLHAFNDPCPDWHHRCVTHEMSYYVPVEAKFVDEVDGAVDQLVETMCHQYLWMHNGTGDTVPICAFDASSRACQTMEGSKTDSEVFWTFVILSCVLVHLKEIMKFLVVLYIIVCGNVSPNWIVFVRESPAILLLMYFKPSAAEEACLHEPSTKQFFLVLLYEVMLENLSQLVLALIFELTISQSGIDMFVCVTIINNVVAVSHRCFGLAKSYSGQNKVVVASHILHPMPQASDHSSTIVSSDSSPDASLQHCSTALPTSNLTPHFISSSPLTFESSPPSFTSSSPLTFGSSPPGFITSPPLPIGSSPPSFITSPPLPIGSSQQLHTFPDTAFTASLTHSF